MRNWIIVFFVIFAARLSAHDGDSIKITHGPYLCDMSTDGVTVVWTTNKPTLSWVEVAPAGEDHFYGKERPRYYDTESGRKRANDISTVYASNIWNPAGNTDTGFFREKLSLGLRVTG